MTVAYTTSGARSLDDAILRRCAGRFVEKLTEVGVRFIARYVAQQSQKPQEA